MDQAYLEERIAKTKTLILAYEAAVEAIAGGQVQEYLLDTGQSRQRVTRLDLTSLNTQLDGLYNRLTVFQNQLTGAGSFNVGPTR